MIAAAGRHWQIKELSSCEARVLPLRMTFDQRCSPISASSQSGAQGRISTQFTGNSARSSTRLFREAQPSTEVFACR